MDWWKCTQCESDLFQITRSGRRIHLRCVGCGHLYTLTGRVSFSFAEEEHSPDG